MNVIIIVIDALRPDHLSINSYSRETSPRIDKIAKEGVSFSNVFTVLPNSEPTFASILTGMYPHSHEVRMLFNNKLKQNTPTIQQILKSHGYATAYTKSGNAPKDGTQVGFDYCDPLASKIKNKIKRIASKCIRPNYHFGMAEQQVDISINWIRKNINKKFFLFMHTNDLHWPYPIPAPYDHIFDPNYKGSHDFATLSEGKISRGDLIFGHKKLPEEEIKHAIAHYDGGIRFIDEHIGRLLNFLDDNKLSEDTLLILAADHGESFGEHNYYFQHGEHLYNQALKIPLIIRNPKKIPKNKKIDGLAQSVDIMPTILEMLGITLIDNIDGVSLMPLIEGKKIEVRKFAFAESVENYFRGNKRVFFEGVKGKWRAMIAGKWKIIYIPHPENDIFELYDIENDPEEASNLIEDEKGIAEEMEKKILEFMKGQSMEGNAKVEDLSEKSRKLLIKAGYLE